MMSQLRTRILECWDEWSLEGPKPYDLSFIRRSSTWLGDAGKVVFYIFRRGERQPVLIGKTVQSSQYGDTIRREAQNLFSVWKRASDAMPNTVPRPVALLDIGGLPVYLEEAIPGIALPERVMRRWRNRKRYEMLAEGVSAAGVWLSKFVEVMGVERIFLDLEEIETRFLNPMRVFRARAGLGSSEQKMLNGMEKAVLGWKGVSLPMVAVHGDFWGGSLLWGDDDKLRIIDWEFFQPRSLPLFDAFMLAVHPGVALNSDGYDLACEFSMCFEKTIYSKQIRYLLSTLSKQLGLEKDVLELLFQLFLIKTSIQRDQAQIEVGAERRATWSACLEYYLLNREQLSILP